ncbi:unnamed protein product, partial [Brassica rapa subsp. narinosa]
STSHTVYGPRLATWPDSLLVNLKGFGIMMLLSTTSRGRRKANGTWSRAPSYF